MIGNRHKKHRRTKASHRADDFDQKREQIKPNYIAVCHVFFVKVALNFHIKPDKNHFFSLENSRFLKLFEILAFKLLFEINFDGSKYPFRPYESAIIQ
jgi:hypothetical protein